jgi:hypothetical protein
MNTLSHGSQILGQDTNMGPPEKDREAHLSTAILNNKCSHMGTIIGLPLWISKI